MTLYINGKKVNTVKRIREQKDGIARDVVNGVYQIPDNNKFTLPSNATDVGSYVLNNLFSGNTLLTSVDLSSLLDISGEVALYYTFYGCTSLISVDLSSLLNISGRSALYSAFRNCTSLTSVDLSSLLDVDGAQALYSAFYNCTSLTSVDLSSLTTVRGNSALGSVFYNCSLLTSVNLSGLVEIGVDSSVANNSHFKGSFSGCMNLISITFDNLEKIYCTGSSYAHGTFNDNYYIQKMYFPKLDTITYGSGASSSNQTACKNIFSYCNSLTELHFSASNQSAIEASPGYSTAWGRGAGNVTIYFDL